MKTLKKYICMSLCAVLGAFVAACTDNQSNLVLSGDCLVQEFEVAGSGAEIDRTAYTITVQVPEDTPLDDVEVTKLVLSDGAVADVVQGAHLNLTVPRAIQVTNGSLKQVWTVRVKVMQTQILSFTLGGFNGVIDQAAQTITVYLKEGTDITSIKPYITVSEGATVDGNEVSADFTSVRHYIVKNGNALRDYTVSVVLWSTPKALYISGSARESELNMEERTAYEWMKANVPMTAFASLRDIADGTTSLDVIDLIYWHCAKDNGALDGHDPFMAYVANAVGCANNMDALNAAVFNKLGAYYSEGGSMLLTRYATILPPFIGTSIDAGGGWMDTWATPNNCWQARNEEDPELCGGPWTFSIYGDNIGHPLFADLVGGGTATVYCTDKDYGVTNSVVCYNHAEGWSEYSGANGYNHWNERVQGRILGVNDPGNGNIVAWEFPAKGGAYGQGGIICLGTGCFDWYSARTGAEYKENYHRNIARMAGNACRYLMGN